MGQRLLRSPAERLFPGSSPGVRFIFMIEIKKGIYRHYKGNLYRVIGVGRHSETLEEYVVYQALYESEFGKEAIWVRPIGLFLEKVNVDGESVSRFTFIKNEV